MSSNISGGQRVAVLVAAAAAIGVVGAGIGAAATTSTAAPAPTVTTTTTATVPGPTVTPAAVTQTVTARPTAPAVTVTRTAAPPAPKATIGDDGTYTVGVDIPAGTYVTIDVAGPDCYWAITRTGSNGGDIVANHIGGGHPRVSVQRGQDFETERCGGGWARVGG